MKKKYRVRPGSVADFITTNYFEIAVIVFGIMSIIGAGLLTTADIADMMCR